MIADRRGQGTVEVALVLPLIVMGIAAIVDFARYYNVQQTMHRISNVGLNYATQRKDSQDYPSAQEIESRLRAAVLPPLSSDHLQVLRIDTGEVDDLGKKSVKLELAYLVPLITPILGAFFEEGGVKVRTDARLPYPEHERPAPEVTPTPIPPPAFSVDGGGGIEVTRSGTSVRVKVIGKQLTVSGNEIPITLKYSFRGDSFMDAFGGEPIDTGDEFILESLADGDWLSFRARGRLVIRRGADFDVTLDTSDPDDFGGRWRDYNHTYSLRAGDPAIFYKKPEVSGTLDQHEYMGPYLDGEEATVRLTTSDLLVVFEYEGDYDDEDVDFQDLVLLLQFYDPLAGPAPTVP